MSRIRFGIYHTPPRQAQPSGRFHKWSASQTLYCHFLLLLMPMHFIPLRYRQCLRAGSRRSSQDRSARSHLSIKACNRPWSVLPLHLVEWKNRERPAHDSARQMNFKRRLHWVTCHHALSLLLILLELTPLSLSLFIVDWYYFSIIKLILISNNK